MTRPALRNTEVQQSLEHLAELLQSVRTQLLFIDGALRIVADRLPRSSAKRPDPWKAMVEQHLQADLSVQRISMRELLSALGFGDESPEMTRALTRRVGRCIASIGWQRHRDGKNKYFYERPPRTAE